MLHGVSAPSLTWLDNSPGTVVLVSPFLVMIVVMITTNATKPNIEVATAITKNSRVAGVARPAWSEDSLSVSWACRRGSATDQAIREGPLRLVSPFEVPIEDRPQLTEGKVHILHLVFAVSAMRTDVA